ncbi:DUF2478 domain-containing protein [Brucella intermedia]|uniref:Nucleoside-triphosphatase THEP1 n=5 Tax=Brucella TaxID=234 RepID=A0ABR6ALK7_9HYPH|nr:DUF2478 domain-containing protein [Brucella intermedia]NKC28630.1 DUF2478 domain-containing protein [Brucella ciceri]PJT19425.1 DUF2478 domain-containing protein [Ochrobactrum sp. 30A/1000/2015]PJT39360.1 DUF2478 domain-containing protein [Ochrobactrum sp. 27A/999/2015]PJT43653.1 DUF2478 domain-containing protein [Ochrobactrum sp. 23A/997/2015]HCH72832.1 DUF2478 domain-containing protein [Ochrobactrum sp.]
MRNEPTLAAILAAKDVPVDQLLAGAAHRARQAGLRVAGFLQHRETGGEECCRDIEIEHIGTGVTQIISQALGSGSKGCRLDPAALADVAGALQTELDDGADMLILNRFGKGETEGHGFRSIIETAYARQIPVLTVVRETYVEGWNDFAGDCGVLLAPDSKAVLGWCDRVMEARRLPEAV